jgi:DNA-binding Lrp family transcriptional regulator
MTLATLEKHGRISNDDLAARVGLSPSPCLRRVRRLEHTGVIRGYQAWSIPQRSVAVCGSSLACGSSGTLARTSSPSNER